MSICFLSNHYGVKPDFHRAALGAIASDFKIILFNNIFCLKYLY